MAAGTSAVLMVIGGGAAGIAALTSDEAKPRIAAPLGAAAGAGPAPEPLAPVPPVSPLSPIAPVPPVAKSRLGADLLGSRTAAEADRSAPRNPIRAGVATVGAVVPAHVAAPAEAGGPAAKPAAAPVVTTRTDTETREIPYPTRTVRDPSLPRGTQRVQSPGVVGEETLRYLVTLTNGRPTGRRLLDSTVTRQPQREVVALGDESTDQSDWQGGRGGPGWRHRHLGGHRPPCDSTLDFCVPLGRGMSCPSEEDERLEDASAVQLGGEVTVPDGELDMLPGNGIATVC